MASESRLYTFSQETKDKLRKFRLSTSRAKDPQAIICTPPFPYALLPLSLPVSESTTSAGLQGEADSQREKEDQIDKKTLEISQADDEVYKDMNELADELPDNSPRFVLLSYPLTLSSGRLSVPYVMLNYLPPTCSQEMRMLYAGAKELLRNQSEAGRIIEIDSAEELETIEEKLKGED